MCLVTTKVSLYNYLAGFLTTGTTALYLVLFYYSELLSESELSSESELDEEEDSALKLEELSKPSLQVLQMKSVIP